MNLDLNLKIKIKIITIVKITTVFILFFMAGYKAFNLVSVSGLTNYDFRLTTPIGFILALFLMSKVNGKWCDLSKGFRKYIIAAAISITILAVYTVIIYPEQPFQLTLRVVCQYLIVIWTVPLYYWLRKDNNEDGLLEILNLISVIWCALILTQSIYYDMTGKVIFSFIEELSSGLRNEKIRISIGPFVNFSIIYCFWKCYNVSKKIKMKYLISLVILTAGNIYVMQSRVSTLAIGVTLIVMALFDDNKGYKFLRKAAIVLGGMIILIMTNFLMDYLINIFTKYEISVSARAYALSYYLGGYFLKTRFSVSDF